MSSELTLSRACLMGSAVGSSSSSHARASARPVMLLFRRPHHTAAYVPDGPRFRYLYLRAVVIRIALHRPVRPVRDFTAACRYIAIALGATLSAQIGGRLMDWIWKRQKERYPEREPVPKYRLPYMVPGALVFPLALFLYGWAAEYELAWPVVDLGVILFTWGNFMFTQGALAYILDEFGTHSASANAATRMFSYVLGFAFPLFAPQLYQALGYGWSGLLALLGVGFGSASCGCLCGSGELG